MASSGFTVANRLDTIMSGARTCADISDAEAGGDARGADLVVTGQHEHSQPVCSAGAFPPPGALPKSRHRRVAARPHLVLKGEYPACVGDAIH